MPDKEQLADGDSGFIGVNSRVDPGALKQGMVSDARNVVFRNGVAETRKGVTKPAWLNDVRPEVWGNQIHPWETGNLGAGVYRDPNSLEYVITAAAGAVYFCRENNDPRKLILPTGVEIHSDVSFVQAFNKMFMFRGKDLAPLVLSTVDAGFADLVSHWSSGTTYTASTSEVAWGPWKAVSTATYSTTTTNGVSTYTALITTAAEHGYVTGADITVRGASQSAYNGRFNIRVTSPTQFTYILASQPAATPATGTITCSNMQSYWKAASGYSAGNEPGVTGWDQISTILPNSDMAAYIQNRVVVGTAFNASTLSYAGKKDFLFCTDILDYQHVFFTSQFRINEGSDDELVDILKINENQLVIFKSKSVHLLTNFIITDSSTTLASSLKLETLIPEYGSAAPRAAVLVGPDVYFWASRRGVVSMRQNEQGKIQGVDVPISEPIQSLIDRVDPRHEGKIRIAYADNRLWVAVPLDDGSDGNNCILVYDFLNKAWSGRYDGEAIKVKEFFKASYSGAERLFFVGTDGYVNLLDESDGSDEVVDYARENWIGHDDIESMVLTRGYSHPDLNQRFFKSARFSIGTWNPRFSASLVMDGANERQPLTTDRTKSRTDYYRPFDKAPFDESNVNEDHSTPYRQDYSTSVTEQAFRMGTEAGESIITEDGDYLMAGGVGSVRLGGEFIPFRFQETQESFKVSAREGRFGQLELINKQGRIQLKQAIMTTETGAQNIQVKS